VTKRVILIAVAVLLGGAWYLGLPPRRQADSAGTGRATAGVRGAIHIHTNRSDGTGSVDDVAAAAAAAGLDFIILTDHGDAAREPDPPQYRSGVLCIDAAEISTQEGHLVALGLPKSPFPLGGEARDVVDDITRMGGLAIAAHPGSAKAELRWSDWDVPLHGLEWLNADSEWRDETGWSLTRALLSYPARPTETLSRLLDRPVPVLQQWDRLTRNRRVIALAGADAHGRIGLRSLGEPYDAGGVSLHVPSYERVMGVFSNVLPGTVLTGDPIVDARAVIDAIRGGQVYSRIDALGAGALRFAAGGGEADVAGDVMQIDGEVTLHAAVESPVPARIALFKDGQVVATGEQSTLEHRAGAPGAYRVEVSLPGSPGEPPVPWIVSNPIYVGRAPAAGPAAARPAAASSAVQYADGPASRWTVETSAASRAALDVADATNKGTQLALRYALGGTAAGSAYAAFVMSSGASLAEYDRLTFTANATVPMRVSVQLRAPGGTEGNRWRRSVFIDTMPREITVYFDDMRPVGATRPERPALADVDSILFVIDTVNTPLGGNGRLWIDNVRYER
jgi:hypothetical protein